MVDLCFLHVILPTNGVNFDIVQFLYDILLNIFLGYAVWFKTDEAALRREERANFFAEQQQYSRYLGEIVTLLHHINPADESYRKDVEMLLEDRPVRSTFVFEGKPDSGLFCRLTDVLGNIQGLLVSEDAPAEEYLHAAKDLSDIRRKILTIKIDQPKFLIWKVWGKRALWRSN